MKLLFPKLKAREFASLLSCAAAGALVAGVYGIVHDQITYTLSPEYFTKFKFEQFAWADFGFPVRVFVAEIGFLATWWVGFIAGWFLGRLAGPGRHPRDLIRRVATGFGWMFASALVAALCGEFWNRLHPMPPDAWVDWCEAHEIVDVRGFVRVGRIHSAGYIGAAAGVLLAWVLEWRRRRSPTPAGEITKPVDSVR